MTKTTIEVLREAREWLSVEEHWCQRYRWSKGRNCALGAIERANYPEMSDDHNFPIADWQPIQEPLMRLAEAAEILVPGLNKISAAFFGISESIGPHWAVTTLNDKYSYAQVCAMFDLAIKLEQEEMDRQAKNLVESGANGQCVAEIKELVCV